MTEQFLYEGNDEDGTRQLVGSINPAYVKEFVLTQLNVQPATSSNQLYTMLINDYRGGANPSMLCEMIDEVMGDLHGS